MGLRTALVAVAFAAVPLHADAQCALGQAAPAADAALGHPWLTSVVRPSSAPILSDDRGIQTIADPLNPRRTAALDTNADLAVVTASRGLAIRAHGGGHLLAGPLGRDGRLSPVHQADNLGEVLDAVDGAAGETWVVLHERPLKSPPGTPSSLTVYRLDAAGKIGAGTVIARGDVTTAHLARSADGRLAVAWASAREQRLYTVTSLWLAWLDANGQQQGQPVRVDGVLMPQLQVEVAVAASGKGVVVAWNPWTPMPTNKDVTVPVELRAFHVDPGAAARLTRRESLPAIVAGSSALPDIRPNLLQAASADGQAVLTWTLVGREAVPLFAAPAEGGAPTTVAAKVPGLPLLRSDGKQLVVFWWVPRTFQHSRAALTCKPGAPGAAPQPVDPPPADPSTAPLSRANLDGAWKHLEGLPADEPKAKEVLDRVHAMKPAQRAAAEARLSSAEGRSDGRYECVMAARVFEQLALCEWP